MFKPKVAVPKYAVPKQKPQQAATLSKPMPLSTLLKMKAPKMPMPKKVKP
jgi:hypothetical protein